MKGYTYEMYQSLVLSRGTVVSLAEMKPEQVKLVEEDFVKAMKQALTNVRLCLEDAAKDEDPAEKRDLSNDPFRKLLGDF